MSPSVHEIIQSFDTRTRENERKIHEVVEKEEAEPKRLLALVAHDNMKQAMLVFIRKYETFFSNISILLLNLQGS